MPFRYYNKRLGWYSIGNNCLIFSNAKEFFLRLSFVLFFGWETKISVFGGARVWVSWFEFPLVSSSTQWRNCFVPLFGCEKGDGGTNQPTIQRVSSYIVHILLYLFDDPCTRRAISFSFIQCDLTIWIEFAQRKERSFLLPPPPSLPPPPPLPLLSFSFYWKIIIIVVEEK